MKKVEKPEWKKDNKMEKLLKKPTQEERILDALREAKGEWVNGQYLLRELFLSQYHARIFSLIKKGYKIETSPFRDEFNFCSYRLLEEPRQEKLL